MVPRHQCEHLTIPGCASNLTFLSQNNNNNIQEPSMVHGPRPNVSLCHDRPRRRNFSGTNFFICSIKTICDTTFPNELVVIFFKPLLSIVQKKSLRAKFWRSPAVLTFAVVHKRSLKMWATLIFVMATNLSLKTNPPLSVGPYYLRLL